MKTYSVGRGDDCDILIDDPSVSRKHAEFVVTLDGEFYLSDCASTQGTYIAEDGDWAAITQRFVNLSDKLLFGRHQIGVNEVIHRVKALENGRGTQPEEEEDDDSRPFGRVQRDIETGEPVAKK